MNTIGILENAYLFETISYGFCNINGVLNGITYGINTIRIILIQKRESSSSDDIILISDKKDLTLF